jgi:hypothetical protein
MKYVELHYFPDARFVSDGFTHFVWGVYENTMLPTFRPEFGIALEVAEGAEPAPYARYNPSTNAFAAPLAPDHVADLPPFYAFEWDNEQSTWRPRPMSTPEE